MPLHMPTLKKRTSASSVASQPRVVEAPMPAKAGTLATLAMLKNMGYRDVWCRTAEVTPAIIAEAGAEGWVISDAQQGRVRFTRVPPPPPDVRTSTHSRNGSQDSHVSAVSQAHSYHTIGHRSDTSSTSGHRPTSSASSRYSQDSAAPSAYGRHSNAPSVSGGYDRTQLSPKSPGPTWQGLRSPSPLGPGRLASPRSPGGVSPSAGLAARTPELRVLSPEGVVIRPDLGPVDGYFDYSPHLNRLSDLPEDDENSSGTSSPRTRSRHRTIEPEDIERPLFRHSPDPEGIGALDLAELASWVPRIEDTQTSNSLFTFDRPRTPVGAPSSVVSPLELGRRTPWDVDEASFEFDSPGFAEMFARPSTELRLPPARNQSPQTLPVSVHEADGRPGRLETAGRNVAPLDRTPSRERLPILSPRWQCRDT